MSTEPRSYPEGMTAASSRAEVPIRMKADVVVVGLGAGGGMVLHDLALAGVDVLGVEMGGHFTPEEMTLQEEKMLPSLFCEGASRATVDMAIKVMQGKGVGGSTIHNTNLCKRLPQAIVTKWARAGVEGLGPELERDFEAVEKLLNVHRIPDDRVNANNEVLLRGIESLGYEGGRLAYNRKLCKASGFCELGCPNDGKENATRRLILPALKNGARVLIEARVDRVLHEANEVVGVAGRAVDPETGADGAPFEIRAPRVVLSASATGSAAVAIKSGVPDPYALIGERLHLHPGAFVMGVFDEPIEGWLGVPQSAECTEFLDYSEGASQRVWLVSGFTHPGAAAGLMPGFGPAHGAMMGLFPHVAAIIAMVHDHQSGRVRPGEGERVHIHYQLDADELAQVALGLREAARILFAAGARQVILPTSPPRIAEDMSEVAEISAGDLGPFNPPMVAVHPMSTMWMGSDPKTSVVDSFGAHHHLKGLVVADGSLFPSSIGGPPQIPIYTMGRRVARAMVERGL